jgi:hypothetical protein
VSLITKTKLGLSPWHTTDDDDQHGGASDDDDDNGDSIHNRYHPGLDTGSRRTSWGAKSVRLAGAGDNAPTLGNGRGATFRSCQAILVGAFLCPVIGSRDVGCQAAVLRIGSHVVAGTEIPAKSGQVESYEADFSLCLQRPDDGPVWIL